MYQSSVGWMWRTVSAVGAAVVLGVGSAAWAASESRPVTLTWDAPAGCPTADEVLDEVDRNLVEPDGAPTPVTATVRVSADPGEVWQASLILDVFGARTERRFRAESCAAIAAATAIIIAVAVQDASVQDASVEDASVEDASVEGASVASPNPAPPLPAQDGGTPRPTTAPSAARAEAAQPYMMANGLVDWDTMPSPPAPGLEIAVGQGWSADRWHLRWVAGADLFPSHPPPTDVQYLGAVNGAFWLLGVSGRGCLGVAMSRLEIGPCLGAELVAMHASAGGNVNPGLASLSNQTLYWLSLLGSVAASWNVSGPMDVVLRADLVVPTARKIFGLEDNVLQAYRVPAFAVRGALGFEVRFP
jgi:hypothetical protein